MVRKEKKYNFIYKTINILSGKYYIGMHSTNDLKDGYLGSGNRIRMAIRKYGKENFVREILEFCGSREELFNRESEIVNLDEIAKKECVNLTVGGGANGFKNEEHRNKCQVAGAKAIHKKLENDPDFKKYFCNRVSDGLKKAYKNGKKKPTFGMLNKKHSDETKKLMSKKAKGVGVGNKNSQYGTCWITKNGDNKKIKKENLNQYIKEGWNKGRKYIAK